LNDVFQQPYPNIRLLKLDVEGFEAEALKGARQLFTSGAVQAIFMEVSIFLREQGSSGAELISLLSEYHCVFIYEDGRPMSEGHLRNVACPFTDSTAFFDIIAVFDKKSPARKISCNAGERRLRLLRATGSQAVIKNRTTVPCTGSAGLGCAPKAVDS